MLSPDLSKITKTKQIYKHLPIKKMFDKDEYEINNYI